MALVDLEHAPKQLKRGKVKRNPIDEDNIIRGKRVKFLSSNKPKASTDPAPQTSGKFFPLQVGDGVSADPRLFDGHSPGSYSNQNPTRRIGVIKKT